MTDQLQSEIHLAVHDMLWDTSHPIDAEQLPAWWSIKLEHHTAQVKRLEQDCDRLLAELSKDAPNPRRVLDMLGDAERGLGRVHGILGRLPVICILPPDVSRKHNQACAGATIWLQARLGDRDDSDTPARAQETP